MSSEYPQVDGASLPVSAPPPPSYIPAEPEKSTLPEATNKTTPVPRMSISDNQPINSPIHYTRDPTRLIAYLIPFPTPTFKHPASPPPPHRFLIYTPPPPPLVAPLARDNETHIHKIQRKWESQVREAKNNTNTVDSWKGIKAKVILEVNKALSWVKSSDLDFLNRVPVYDAHSKDNPDEDDKTKATVGLDEMVLIYPSSLTGSESEIREEFIKNMLRTKSKAQRDAIISTGLIPVAIAIDILATFIWPFGGLTEVDSVFAYTNIRGAKTARSVTKRLNSSTKNGSNLKLTFTPSPRLEILTKYLETECHARDPGLFPKIQVPPTDDEVLSAIGWSASHVGGERENWEDEKWEEREVKEDLGCIMHKGAREWEKWCVKFLEDGEGMRTE